VLDVPERVEFLGVRLGTGDVLVREGERVDDDDDAGVCCFRVVSLMRGACLICDGSEGFVDGNTD